MGRWACISVWPSCNILNLLYQRFPFSGGIICSAQLAYFFFFEFYPFCSRPSVFLICLYVPPVLLLPFLRWNWFSSYSSFLTSASFSHSPDMGGFVAQTAMFCRLGKRMKGDTSTVAVFTACFVAPVFRWAPGAEVPPLAIGRRLIYNAWSWICAVFCPLAGMRIWMLLPKGLDIPCGKLDHGKT